MMSKKERYLLPIIGFLLIVFVVPVGTWLIRDSNRFIGATAGGLLVAIGAGFAYSVMAIYATRVENYYIGQIRAMLDTLKRAVQESVENSENRYPIENIAALQSELESLIPKRSRGRPRGLIYPPGFEKMGMKISDALPGLAELHQAKERRELRQTGNVTRNPWGGAPISYYTVIDWLRTYKKDIVEFVRNSDNNS